MAKLVGVVALIASVAAVAVSPAVGAKGHGHKAKKHEASIYLSSGFTCSGGATDTSGQTYGRFKAMLRDKGATVSVQVKLRGADANSTYGIYVNQDPGGCPTTQVATLTTDKHGSGELSMSVAHAPGATVAWVSAVDTSQTLRSTAVTLSK